MPTNHTTQPTVLAARISRLVVDAQRIADELIADSLCDPEAEIYLAGPALLATSLSDDLADAMYRSEAFCLRHLREDRATAGMLAAAHGTDRQAA